MPRNISHASITTIPKRISLTVLEMFEVGISHTKPNEPGELSLPLNVMAFKPTSVPFFSVHPRPNAHHNAIHAHIDIMQSANVLAANVLAANVRSGQRSEVAKRRYVHLAAEERKARLCFILWLT